MIEIGKPVIVTKGHCQGQVGVVTGYLNKPVDDCDHWVWLNSLDNPVGFRFDELRLVGLKRRAK